MFTALILKSINWELPNSPTINTLLEKLFPLMDYQVKFKNIFEEVLKAQDIFPNVRRHNDNNNNKPRKPTAYTIEFWFVKTKKCVG